MVLGLGSKSKKKSKNVEEGHRVVRTPSLPEFSTGVLPWPENLVDIQAVRDGNSPPTTPQGAAKTSFSIPTQARSNIAFHRPFRLSESSNGHSLEPLRSPTGADGQPGAQAGIPGVPPIASLFVSQHPPSAFDLHSRSGTYPGSGSRSAKTRISQRRAKVSPTFNVMVAGAQGLGKTSLLRLLIDTADISPTAAIEQIASMERFLRVTGRRTTKIETATIEICESRFDRLSLTIIDTPGLDFQEGRELKLDRQVSTIVRYLDLQYADTMDEESKVVRRSKGDQHVHLCIYLVDPDTVISPFARRALGSIPNGSSAVTLKNADGTNPATDAQEDESPQERLSMSATEIRIIKRLSTRVNVLPVIARSDVLTDEKLTAVKAAVKRDLQEAGLGFGVFMSPKLQSVEEDEEVGNESMINGKEDGHTSVEGTEAETHEGTVENKKDDEDADDGDRQSRPVIKLRHNKRDTSRRSRSRSRVTLIEANRGELEPLPPDATDADSVANVRFSAHILAQNTRIEEVLPFALIMPEQAPGRRRALKQPPPLSRPQSEYIPDSVAAAAANGDVIANGAEVSARGADGMLASPVDAHSETRSLNKKFLAVPYSNGPPRDLKGVFLRKFRWGTVDVLNPAHCDFAALRTSIFSTHLKVLKTNTREVLYEKYRTEKLLARRATRNISQQDHKLLLEDLGL